MLETVVKVSVRKITIKIYHNLNKIKINWYQKNTCIEKDVQQFIFVVIIVSQKFGQIYYYKYPKNMVKYNTYHNKQYLSSDKIKSNFKFIS